jgi:hypothetical protein
MPCSIVINGVRIFLLLANVLCGNRVDTIVHLYVLVFPASSIRTLVRGMVTMQTCMWHASAVFSYVYPSVPAVGIGVLKKDH